MHKNQMAPSQDQFNRQADVQEQKKDGTYNILSVQQFYNNPAQIRSPSSAN
jgi:hypothetical protein